jgi:hypothetical protein
MASIGEISLASLARHARTHMTTSPASAIQARALTALAAHRAQTPVPAWPEAPQLRALLLDAAGTLLSPSEPAALVIQRHARPYGCKLTELEILKNFRWCRPTGPLSRISSSLSSYVI